MILLTHTLVNTAVQAGKYFTTQIWHFDLKCHLCDHMMVVGTDPENCTYKCVSGCRRKVESWEEDEDTLKRPDIRDKRKMEDDPFYRLEHYAAADGSGRTSDEVRGKEAKASLYQLKAMQVLMMRGCECVGVEERWRGTTLTRT